jgi:hypothetical protein
MRCSFRVALIVMILSGLHFSAWSAPEGLCEANTTQGIPCSCSVADLHPTQLTVGMLEVKHLGKKLLQELQQDMARPDHEAKIVIASDGGFYLTDGHHHALAIYNKESRANTTCIVTENDYNTNDQSLLSSSPNFWYIMESRKHARLYDENGHRGIPPQTLGGLRDDKYRTLSSWIKDWLKDNCGIMMPGDYAQFQWADIIRANDSAKNEANKSLDAAATDYPKKRQREKIAAVVIKKLSPTDLQKLTSSSSDYGSLKQCQESS